MQGERRVIGLLGVFIFDGLRRSWGGTPFVMKTIYGFVILMILPSITLGQQYVGETYGRNEKHLIGLICRKMERSTSLSRIRTGCAACIVVKDSVIR